MGYVAARRIYCIVYENAVVNTEAYVRLKREYLSGKVLMIVDLISMVTINTYTT